MSSDSSAEGLCIKRPCSRSRCVAPLSVRLLSNSLHVGLPVCDSVRGEEKPARSRVACVPNRIVQRCALDLSRI